MLPPVLPLPPPVLPLEEEPLLLLLPESIDTALVKLLSDTRALPMAVCIWPEFRVVGWDEPPPPALLLPLPLLENWAVEKLWPAVTAMVPPPTPAPGEPPTAPGAFAPEATATVPEATTMLVVEPA